MEYIIGSGWWCRDFNSQATRFGRDLHNVYDMGKIWYQNMFNLTNPKRIVIIDSNSPLLPPFAKESNVEIIRLLENFRSPPYQIPDKPYGLWSRNDLSLSAAFRQIFTGAIYALMCDVQYFVYIEQDVLIRGNFIIEQAILNMEDHKAKWSTNTTQYMPDKEHRIEAAFLIMDCSIALEFCQAYLNTRISDKKEESVEGKFRVLTKHFPWTKFPFDGSRDRPLNLKQDYCFVHKPNVQEIQEIMTP